MVARAERTNDARPHYEREQHELNRLSEVEGFIQLRATQYAVDDPMLAEDLAQEARERALRELRQAPTAIWLIEPEMPSFAIGRKERAWMGFFTIGDERGAMALSVSRS